MINWETLNTINQLEEINKLSGEKVQLIFKHSTRCSISSMAKSRLEKKWSEKLNITPYYLDLIQHKDVSNAIAEKYSVHHESPQIILIKDGESFHDASHMDISVQEIEEVL